MLATTAVGLLVFALLVTTASADFQRDRVDRRLERHVAAAVDEIGFDDRGDVVVGFDDDPPLADGYPQLYVVTVSPDPHVQGDVVFAPTVPSWPDLDVVGPAIAAVQNDSSEPVYGQTEATRAPPSGERETLRTLAAPMDGNQEQAAVVVAVANAAPAQASHAQLVSAMWRTAGVVLLIGLGVAVLLSGRRWWLVDRVLARHEQFLHDTAHELRSPIYQLRRITDDGLSGREAPEKALQRAAMVTQRTDQVISDLLILSRVETGREELRTEPLRLDELAEVLIDDRADEPAVRLDTRQTVVDGNAELLRHAVGNLLENAYRHGRTDGGQVEVSVTVADGRVTVSDRGPGVVEPQLLTHLMQRTRTRSWDNGRDPRASSLGLGLTIAGWVARIHGGELVATNRQEGGASFTLQLPEM